MASALYNLLNSQSTLSGFKNEMQNQVAQRDAEFLAEKSQGRYDINPSEITGYAGKSTSTPTVIGSALAGATEGLLPFAKREALRYEMQDVDPKLRDAYLKTQDRLQTGGTNLAYMGGQMLGAAPFFMGATKAGFAGLEAIAGATNVNKLGLAADGIAQKVMNRVSGIIDPALAKTSGMAQNALKSPIVTGEAIGAGAGVGYDYAMAKSNQEEFNLDQSLMANIGGGVLFGGIEGLSKNALKMKVDFDIKRNKGNVEIVDKDISNAMYNKFVPKDAEFTPINNGKSEYIYKDEDGNTVSFVKDEDGIVRTFANIGKDKNAKTYDYFAYGSKDGSPIAKPTNDYIFGSKDKKTGKESSGKVKYSIIGEEIASGIIDDLTSKGVSPDGITINRFATELRSKKELNDTDKLDALKEFDIDAINDEVFKRAGIQDVKKAKENLSQIEKETRQYSTGGEDIYGSGFDVKETAPDKSVFTEFNAKHSTNEKGDTIISLKGKDINLNSDSFITKVNELLKETGHKESFKQATGTLDEITGKPIVTRTIGADERFRDATSKIIDDIKDGKMSFENVGKSTTIKNDVENLLASKLADKIRFVDEGKSADIQSKKPESENLDFESKHRKNVHEDVGVASEDYGDLFHKQTSTLNSIYRIMSKAIESSKKITDFAKKKTYLENRARAITKKIKESQGASGDISKKNEYTRSMELLKSIGADEFVSNKQGGTSILNDKGTGFDSKFIENMNKYNKQASKARELLQAKTNKEKPVRNFEEQTKDTLNMKKAMLDNVNKELKTLYKSEVKDTAKIKKLEFQKKGLERDIKKLSGIEDVKAIDINEKITEPSKSDVSTKEVVGSEAKAEFDKLKNVYAKDIPSNPETFSTYEKIKDVDMSYITEESNLKAYDKDGNEIKDAKVAGLFNPETKEMKINSDAEFASTKAKTLIHEAVHKLLDAISSDVNKLSEKIFNTMFDAEQRKALEYAYAARKDLYNFKEEVIVDTIGRLYVNKLHKDGIIDSPVNFNEKSLNHVKSEVSIIESKIEDTLKEIKSLDDMKSSLEPDEDSSVIDGWIKQQNEILKELRDNLVVSKEKEKFLLDIFENNKTSIDDFIGKSPEMDAIIMKLIKETNSGVNDRFVDIVRTINSNEYAVSVVGGKDVSYQFANKLHDVVRPYIQKYENQLIDAINEVSWSGYLSANTESKTMRRVASMLNGYHMTVHNSINSIAEAKKQFINEHFGKYGNPEEILGKMQASGLMIIREMFPDKSFDEIVDMFKNKDVYSQYSTANKVDAIVDEIYQKLQSMIPANEFDKIKDLFVVTKNITEKQTKVSFKNGKKVETQMSSFISNIIKGFTKQKSGILEKKVPVYGSKGKRSGYVKPIIITLNDIHQFNKVLQDKIAREFSSLAKKSGVPNDEAYRIGKAIQNMDLSDSKSKFTDNYLQEYAAVKEFSSQMFKTNSIFNLEKSKVKKIFDSEAFKFVSSDTNGLSRDIRSSGFTQHNFGLNPENNMSSKGFKYIIASKRPEGAIGTASYKISDNKYVYAVPETKDVIGQQESLFGQSKMSGIETGVDTITVQAKYDATKKAFYTTNKDGSKEYISKDAQANIVKRSKSQNGSATLTIRIPENFKKFPKDTEGSLYNMDYSKMYQRNMYLKVMNETKNQMTKKALLEASRNGLFLSEGKYARLNQNERNRYVFVDVFGNKGYVPKRHAANFTGTKGFEIDKSKNAFKYYTIKLAKDFTNLVKNNIIVGSLSSFINSAVSSMSIYSLHSKHNNPMEIFRGAKNAEKDIEAFYDLQKKYSEVIANKGDRTEILKEIESHPFYKAIKLGLPVSIRNAEINLGLMNRNGMLTMAKNGLGLGKDTMNILDNFMLQPRSGLGMYLSEYFDRTEIVPKYALFKEKISDGMSEKQALDYVNFAFPYYKMNLSEGAAIADNFLPFMKFFMSVPMMIKHAFDNKSNKLLTMQAISLGSIAGMNSAFEDESNKKEQKLQDYGMMSLPSEFMYSPQSLNPYTTHMPDVLNLEAYQRAFMPYDINPLTYVGGSSSTTTKE